MLWSIYPTVNPNPSSPITGTSHIPLPHWDVFHCLAPAQISPLKAPTQSFDSISSLLINTKIKIKKPTKSEKDNIKIIMARAILKKARKSNAQEEEMKKA